MRLQEISSLFNMNPPLIQNHMAGFQDIYKFANLLWDINSVYLPRNRGTILKDQKSLLTKDKKPAIAAKISGLFLVSRKRELKIRCKKGGTFLTRTLIILPMLRLAGSATSFWVVAAFMLLVRLSHDGRWLKVATGPPVCGCAIRLLQKSHF